MSSDSNPTQQESFVAVRPARPATSRPRPHAFWLLGYPLNTYRFIGHSAAGDSGTLLRFEGPRFGSAAPELFRQQRLWDDGPEPEQTAFELLGAALVDVAARREDSNRFDPGLLRRFARYRALFSRGHLTSIGLPDSVGAASARLDTAVAGGASDLSASTPPTQRVRLVGRLDVMGASQGVLKLELKPGVVVSGLLEGDGPVDALKDYFNREVVIEGRAVYRPSGALLRAEVQAIGMATGADEYFRVMPSGRVQADAVRLARLRPGEGSAYARILGRIPAEESDEDFLAAVEALS